MSKKELIKSATESGMLTEMYRAGIVSQKVIMYRDMYYDVQTYREQNKCNQSVAIQAVADKYRVNYTTVFRAIKFITA